MTGPDINKSSDCHVFSLITHLQKCFSSQGSTFKMKIFYVSYKNISSTVSHDLFTDLNDLCNFYKNIFAKKQTNNLQFCTRMVAIWQLIQCNHKTRVDQTSSHTLNRVPFVKCTYATEM